MSLQVCLTRFGMIAMMASSRVRTMSSASAKKFPNTDTGLANAVNKISAANSWCKTARAEPDGLVSLESIIGPNDDNDQPIRSAGDRFFDLTQSTEWMEYIECKENRISDEGGAGAYDTLRCDVIVSPVNGESCTDTRLRVWGEDFHLKRLKESYISLLKTKKDKDKSMRDIDKTTLNGALESSRTVLHALLAEAQASATAMTNTDTLTQLEVNDILIQLFRVTILWSPPSKNMNGGGEDNIVVRGHASCNGKAMEIHVNPKKIKASVAVHAGHGTNNKTTIDKDLPTRHANPQSKIASWCRVRKQMEDPFTYKPPGVSEVIMVRNRQDGAREQRLEVLEGLSSNFFVIYKDGALRTATEGVLNGYVRHLVLECASKCGIRFDPRPIFLDETSQWKEAFITSSSRLIYPISSIVIPEDGTGNLREIWNDGISQENGATQSEACTQKWQELNKEILKTGGYQI